MATTDVVVDVNVLLRYVLGDNDRQSPAARRLLGAGLRPPGTLRVPLSTLSEMVFVIMGPRLSLPPAAALDALDAVFALPILIGDRDVAERARSLYESFSDWDDCVISAYAMRDAGGRVASFDKRLSSFPGVEQLEPQ